MLLKATVVRSGLAVAGAAWLMLAVGIGNAARADDARDILKSMSNYLAAQKTIQVTWDTDIEVITPQLEKIQFTNSGETLLQRPDKLRAHRAGGYADVELVFDGKTAGVIGKDVGYAQVEAAGTLDQLIAKLRAGYGVSLPGADLMVSNVYDTLIADVMEAKHIGRGVIDGVECEHLAFRNFDTDWQLWVEVGGKPFPRKLVITSKTINGAPQYTLRIRDWKTDVQPEANAFAFEPPAGAQKLDPQALSQLDELPEGAAASAGGNK